LDFFILLLFTTLRLSLPFSVISIEFMATHSEFINDEASFFPISVSDLQAILQLYLYSIFSQLLSLLIQLFLFDLVFLFLITFILILYFSFYLILCSHIFIFSLESLFTIIRIILYRCFLISLIIRSMLVCYCSVFLSISASVSTSTSTSTLIFRSPPAHWYILVSLHYLLLISFLIDHLIRLLTHQNQVVIHHNQTNVECFLQWDHLHWD